MSTKQEVADRVSAYLQHGGPMLDHVIDEHIHAYKLKGIINRSEVARIVDKLVHGG